jgi:hypothetical protein
MSIEDIFSLNPTLCLQHVGTRRRGQSYYSHKKQAQHPSSLSQSSRDRNHPSEIALALSIIPVTKKVAEGHFRVIVCVCLKTNIINIGNIIFYYWNIMLKLSIWAS